MIGESRQTNRGRQLPPAMSFFRFRVAGTLFLGWESVRLQRNQFAGNPAFTVKVVEDLVPGIAVGADGAVVNPEERADIDGGQNLRVESGVRSQIQAINVRPNRVTD